MSLLPVEAALAAILSRVPAPEAEDVRLTEALGRVLAAPLVATHNQPPFNASAMDGYAVRSADGRQGQVFSLIGTSQAGAGFPGTVGPNQTVRIFTGAPVPAGADAVIMQEEAAAEGDQVTFSSRPKPGRSIRPTGNDFATGQVLLPQGRALRPTHLAMAAAANAATLSVSRRPRIALLATGDELVPPGTPLEADQIVASNSYGLLPLLSPYAENIEDFGIVGDTRTALRAKLEAVFASVPDVVITTGGASVGDHDIVQEILLDLGVSLDFWRINMRPGKPLMFGTSGRTLIFGLPGNPVSAMVTATAFIKPALRAWLGLAEDNHAWRLPLAAPTPPNSSRQHFMRARLVQEKTGAVLLPILETDSGHTSSLADADMLVIQPGNDPGQPAGTVVDAIAIDAF